MTKPRPFRLISYCALLLGAGLMAACRQSSANFVDEQSDNDSRDAADQWSFIGFGGGGATFDPEVSPHDSENAFLSCDMTGSYHTFNGGESWRMFNLRGVIDSYVYDPVDSKIVYALIRGANGGLYKSRDGGDSWLLHFPERSMVSGIVAKGDHADEMLVTTDSVRHDVIALAIDPESSSKLYAVMRKGDSITFNTSEDGGTHWKEEQNLDAPVKNIFVDPGSEVANRTIYLTAGTSIIERKSDVWTTHTIPAGVKSITSFAGGYNSKVRRFVIYAISGKSYFNTEGDRSGIFFTDNGGSTWTNRQEGLLSLGDKKGPIPEWRSIATSSQHPEVVYVSYANLQLSKDTTAIGVARSTDFGQSWSLVWKDKLASGNDVHAPNRDGGWIDDRYGPTWGENPFAIGVSPQDPDVCYTTDFGRVIKTKDGGKTWKQVYTNKNASGGWTSRGIEVTSNYNVIHDPFDKDHVFIANTDVGLMESFDGTKSWNSATVNNGIPRRWINSTYWVAFDPDVKGKAWAAMSGTHDLPRPKMWRKAGISKFTGGIVETMDGGKTWKPLTSDLGEAAMTHVLMEPASSAASRTLYASAFGKGVYKSVDGGKSWALKNKGIKGDEPFAWRIIRNESDGALYLIVCRRSDDGTIGNEGDGALYKSTDQAESWQVVKLPEEANAPMSLVVDPNHPSTLVLSTWGRVVRKPYAPDIGGGIFYSADNGKSWRSTLSDQHIHDVTYDERVKTFYACGFTGSAYRSEDAVHWERIRGYNFKWGRRVEPDPTDSTMIYVLTFGGGVWYGPATGDVNALEDINLPLPVF